MKTACPKCGGKSHRCKTGQCRHCDNESCGHAWIPSEPGSAEISDRTWNSQQSWYRERIVSLKVTGHVDPFRMRYYVRRNAYDFQSYAEVAVWRGKWEDVYRIPGEHLACLSVSYVDRDVKPSAFDRDIAELERVALRILNLEGLL